MIRGRESLVRRFVDHAGHFQWDWSVGDADEFFAHERSILNLRSPPSAPEGVLRLPDRSGLRMGPGLPQWFGGQSIAQV